MDVRAPVWKRIVDDLASEGFPVQCALEPEFYLLHKVAKASIDHQCRRMFTQAGLQESSQFSSRVVDELRAMGVPVGQLGKEYGPGQYEMSVKHGSPIEAIDRYWALKDAVRDLARECGYVATSCPRSIPAGPAIACMCI